MTKIIFSICILFSISGYSKENCQEKVRTAAVNKMVGNPPKGEFRVLSVNGLGTANKKIGNLRLDLYTVEISDEADGAVMIVFVTKDKCHIHDVVFGTSALAR